MPMFSSKKGFTLLEMMVVILLIGLFFVVTSSMTGGARTNQVNAERLANRVYDTARNARNNMLIGRGAYSGTNLITVTERSIFLSSTGILTRYVHDMTSSGVELVIPFPFLENDPAYLITDISVSSGGVKNGVVPAWDSVGRTNATITINSTSDIDISVVPAPIPAITIRTLKITAGYKGFEQSVIIDRVTGTVEIRKSTED